MYTLGTISDIVWLVGTCTDVDQRLSLHSGQKQVAMQAQPRHSITHCSIRSDKEYVNFLLGPDASLWQGNHSHTWLE